MSSVYLNLCGNEYKLLETVGPQSAGRFSKCCNKNLDIIFLTLSVVFATYAVLIAYGKLPTWNRYHPMYVAGCYATGASFAFGLAILYALRTRGCIVIRQNIEAEEQIGD